MQRRVQINHNAISLSDHTEAVLTRGGTGCGERCAANHSGIVQITGDIGAATQVFRTPSSSVRQILADAETHGLAIQHRTDPTHVEQPSFQRMRQCGFARAGHANKHDCCRLLSKACFTLGWGDVRGAAFLMPRGFDAALNHTGTDCHVGQTVDDDEGSGGDVALVGIEIQCLREVDFAKPNFIQFQYGRRARFQRVDVDLVMDGADLAGQGLAGLTSRHGDSVMLSRRECLVSSMAATMAGAALSANQQAWKFDVTHANQCDYLKYDVEGHYKAHVDTFINPEEKECRKLTVLAFLNDDFEGGRLFLQNGHEKIYPPQKPGTILVFPSFMLHGVEPVTKGIRRSIVTWMVGPWFK